MACSQVVSIEYSIQITEVSSQYRGIEDGRQGVAPRFGIVPGTKQFLASRFCYVTKSYTGLGTETESFG